MFLSEEHHGEATKKCNKTLCCLRTVWSPNEEVDLKLVQPVKVSQLTYSTTSTSTASKSVRKIFDDVEKFALKFVHKIVNMIISAFRGTAKMKKIQTNWRKKDLVVC